jgi:hypothetical protein
MKDAQDIDGVPGGHLILADANTQLGIDRRLPTIPPHRKLLPIAKRKYLVYILYYKS